MSSRPPFLQRRGFSLNFRIAVPADLRAAIGLREVSRALPTTSKSVGALLALQAAVAVKSVFAELRAAGMDMDEKKLAELMAVAKEKIKRGEEKDQHFAELMAEWRRQHEVVKRMRIEGDHAVARARLEGENEGLRRALASGAAAAAAPPSASLAPAPAAAAVAAPTTSPLLADVVKDFLKRHPRNKAAMLKKHQTVLPLFLEVVGNKPVAAIKQSDIKDFLNLVQNLPPRWSDARRRRRISVAKLAEEKHAITMSPKSFDDTYKACLRSFLKDANAQWHDEGFPRGLTTDGLVYQGERVEGDNKQRAFREDELERLLHGSEMAKFAASPELEHRYWMVYLGFFTGARVNELCQINPQVDVLQEPKTNIWYVAITSDTEGDERIKKRTKNKPSKRKVPLHPRLIEMGFLGYADRMKSAGAKLLFPEFKPRRSRASPEAEKWFTTFLRELGLRDETAGARLVGMHAFRHTIMALAFNSNPPQDVTSITGHSGGADSTVAGYQGKLWLTNQLHILEAVQFGPVAKTRRTSS
jgi:integrase